MLFRERSSWGFFVDVLDSSDETFENCFGGFLSNIPKIQSIIPAHARPAKLKCINWSITGIGGMPSVVVY